MKVHRAAVRRGRLVGLIAVGLVLAGCGSSTPPAAPGASGSAGTTGTTGTTTGGPGVAAAIEVELDVYSGRANPAWALTGATAEEFRRRLAALPAGAAWQPAAPLGYRGLVVRWPGDSAPEVAVVQAGRVRWTTGDRARSLTDTGRELERWLVETGRPSVEAATLTIVESALPTP